MILTTRRLMFVGKRSMMDLLLRDITKVGWTKKRLVVRTGKNTVELKGKSRWRRTYDDSFDPSGSSNWGLG